VDGLVARPVEGDTLIVDVSGFREETWFDRAEIITAISFT